MDSPKMPSGMRKLHKCLQNLTEAIFSQQDPAIDKHSFDLIFQKAIYPVSQAEAAE